MQSFEEFPFKMFKELHAHTLMNVGEGDIILYTCNTFMEGSLTCNTFMNM
jgi:hypothetical protein